MCRQTNKNRGFTLIELLISMALLSIIMVMVVQFMSSTAGANRKTQYNMKAQAVANEVMSNISNSLMHAEYVMVVPAEKNFYTLDSTTSNRRKSLTATTSAVVTLPDTCRLVPDNYGNYAKSSSVDERKVIVDMTTYELAGEKDGDVYPLSGDLEQNDFNARSFRILQQSIGGVDTYLYVVPEYIYAEYEVESSTPGKSNLCNVIYKFEGNKIYMYRSQEDSDLGKDTKNRFATAKGFVDANASAGNAGLLTENMTDFYLSADTEGNAFMLNSLFSVQGYQFNSATTVKFRNSQVLTVRPQNLYQKVVKTTP